MTSPPTAWRFAPHFTLSTFVAACLALSPHDSHALALGRIAVQSALGEPLRAEIEVPDINPDEAASLRATVGSPEAFRRAGVEYNALLSGLQVTLQRRADGRSFLRLAGDRIVNDPYLDLIIEATWSAGKLVRDYTLLLDPAPTRQAAPAPVAPLVPSSSSGASAASSTTAARAPAAPPVAAPVLGRASAPPVVARPGRAARPPAPAKEAAVNREGQQVTVQAGDTASKIATAVKPPSVSLDQMLVALLQANPEAFSGGNVNRLRAGTVLSVPSAERAASTPSAEASQIVVAQSRDFNDFRRKLAAGTLSAQDSAPSRTASGKVQATVDDKKTASTSPDKLSLQKGEIAGKPSQDNIAQDLQAKEAAKRLAELNKNINDLNKLAAPPVPAASAPAASKAPATLPTTPASVPGLPVTSAALTPASAPTPSAAVTTPPAPTPSPAASVPVATASVPAAVASTPAAMASAPAASPPPEAPASAAPTATPPTPAASKPAPLPAPAVAEPDSLVDDLLANPMVPAAAGGLVALLAGLGLYRVRQRKKATQVDSSFMESRLQPDSFFGSSGGQKIDTNEAALSGSSMMYSPSQLDAGADVDPVAEADVYLAYGRDLQAEEILKEALRSNPSRAAIHFKLLQIYAKRRDVKAYAASANDAYKLTAGQGSDWAQACETGRELDPSNPLFHGDGASSFADLSPAHGEEAMPPSASLDLSTAASPPAAAGSVDLDLDFSLPEPDAAPQARTARNDADQLAEAFDAEPEAPTVTPPAQALAFDVQSLPDLELDFNPAPSDAKDASVQADTVALPPVDLMPPAEQATVLDTTLDFTATDMGHLPGPSASAPAATAPDALLEFDLDALSLDLDGGKPDATSQAADPVAEEPDGLDGEDPLVTKLALAEEFQAIGDDDGARTLAQEVADSATGSLKAKAQRFLAELS